MSDRIRLRDLQAIHRTVHESCELGDDVNRWRTHLLMRMKNVIGATTGFAFVGRIPFDPTAITPPVFVSVDADPHYLKYLNAGDVSPDPCNQRIVPRLASGLDATRGQLCEDRIWYASEFYNEVLKPIGFDDYAMSVVGLPEWGFFSGIGFARRAREQSFGERERRMLGYLHRELRHLWHTPMLAPEPQWRRQLTPRLREVLDLLLAGFSEKQVALRLGLRRSTVHNHIARLHRALEVNSRGEMLAKARPRPAFRPRLVPEALPTLA